MPKIYIRACDFNYGKYSVARVKKKTALPLNGNKLVSFNCIEILTRSSKKKISIKDISKQKVYLKKKIKKSLSIIIKKKFFKGVNFSNFPILMGIVNLTPDSFSDGGKFNKGKRGYKHIKYLISKGCKIIDIGGESTRPGSREITNETEWKRIKPTLENVKKLKCVVSLDTRKSWIMRMARKYRYHIVNDVSGLSYSSDTIVFLKETQIPFIINHSKGTPQNMQKNPKYKNVLLDVYDFFEKKISIIRKSGIKHNNIILDPGIGFGKNLKHNITLLTNISIFHSLGFPVMLGASRKKFIKKIAGNNESEERLGGTISTSLFALLQGVQILRIHDVNEVMQSLKVFKSLNK